VVETCSVNEGIDAAREVSPEEGIILITGSLYLVAEARSILTRK